MKLVLGLVVVIAVAMAALGGCAGLLDWDGSNAAKAAQAAADAERWQMNQEAYKADQVRLANEAQAQAFAQQQAMSQAQETARLAYLNQAAQAQRDFYAYLVAAGSLTPVEAARALQGQQTSFLDRLNAVMPWVAGFLVLVCVVVGVLYLRWRLDYP